jgi:two-component system response regulator
MTLSPKNKADITILLVEDDEDDQYIVKKAMEQTNHRIYLEMAVNGQDALNKLQSDIEESSEIPNIIILDLNMPVMDGREFLKKARSDENLKQIPIIVLTTSREPEILEEALELGANATLSKGTTVEANQALAIMIIDYWFSGTIEWHLH